MKKLLYNKHFHPCPVVDGDELYPNGIFVFNITRLLSRIQDIPADFPVEQVAVAQFHASFSVINEDHVNTVDVSKPVILGEIAPGRFNLIDGNHRMELARRKGLETVPAHRIRMET